MKKPPQSPHEHIPWIITNSGEKTKLNCSQNAEDKGSWYDRPLWIAVIGSIIVMVSQLFGTIFPIAFGPDLSDYKLVCDPFNPEIKYEPMLDRNCSVNNGMNVTTYKLNYSEFYYNYIFTLNITLCDIHPIQGYKGEVFLTAICPPGFNVEIPDPIINSKKSTIGYIRANVSYLINLDPEILETGSTYLITIQAIGSDGKERNSTIIAGMKPLVGYNVMNHSIKIDPTPPKNIIRHIVFTIDKIPIQIQQNLFESREVAKNGERIKIIKYFVGTQNSEYVGEDKQITSMEMKPHIIS